MEPTTEGYSYILLSDIEQDQPSISKQELRTLVARRISFNLEVLKLWRESEFPPFDTWRSNKDDRRAPNWSMIQHHRFNMNKLCCEYSDILSIRGCIVNTYHSCVAMWQIFGKSPIIDYLVWTEKHVFMHSYQKVHVDDIETHEAYKSGEVKMDRLVKKWSEEVDVLCRSARPSASAGEEWQLYSGAISSFQNEVHVTPARIRRKKYWDDWLRRVLLNQIHGSDLVQAPPSTTAPSRKHPSIIQYSDGGRIDDGNEKGLFPPCMSRIIDKKKRGNILHLSEERQLGTFLLSAKQSYDTVLKYLLSGRQNVSSQAITDRVKSYTNQPCKGCDTLFKDAVKKKKQNRHTLLVGCPMTDEANKASGLRFHERILCEARFIEIHGKQKRIQGYTLPQDGRLPTDWSLNLY
eukprot:scaffold16561_cov117-Cyclotella_meneghiniana.AAC.3